MELELLWIGNHVIEAMGQTRNPTSRGVTRDDGGVEVRFADKIPSRLTLCGLLTGFGWEAGGFGRACESKRAAYASRSRARGLCTIKRRLAD